jgi:hypothetical protein
MIKARAGKTLILGLSDNNMLRLKKGEPIKFSLRQLGMDLSDVEIVIYNGKTEDSMQADLQEFITELTKYTNTKRDLQ